MTKLYRATNPQQIIDHFERMAKIAEVSSVGAAYGVQERALYKREAVTWQAAADILRQTEFIGWDLHVERETRRDYPEEFERPEPTKEEMERMADRYNERHRYTPAPGKVMHAPPGTVPHPTAHLTDEQRLAEARAHVRYLDRKGERG